MLTAVTVTNPRYSNSDNTAIDCTVVWNDSATGLDLDPMEFTAMADDNQEHGVSLFTSLANGDYGTILPFPSKELSDYKKDLADLRYEKETQGITVNTVGIQTDRLSRQAMNEKVTESVINGITDVTWKLQDGSFVVYTIQDFRKVFQKVALYAEACFAQEKVLYDALIAATDPSTVDLESGWPITEYTVT